jgi:hypothetical protein
MHRISTGVEQLLTADALADAVLTYATALARAGTADTVTIPIVRDDGAVDEARLLLGPASQLTIVPDSDTDVDLPSADAVLEDLQRRTARLEPRPVQVEPVEEGEASFPDFEEYD